MSFSVQEVVQWTGGRWVNAAELQINPEEIRVSRPASLGVARSSELAFFFSRVFEHELPSSRPGILVTGEGFVESLQAAHLPFWTTTAVIACRDPYFAMALLSEKFGAALSSVAHVPTSLSSEKKSADIHPTAIVSLSAELGLGVKVGPYCVIEDQVKIGSGTILYAGCYIGPGSTLGRDCVLFPQVKLYEWTQLGDRVRIHAGSVIGSDGFGYAPKREGRQLLGHQKIYHLGKVVIEDDVEIGANSCVDRSTFGETKIGKFSKLDNLVHIGHNASLDEGAIICGGTCLAGGASIGKYAYIGGLTGITNNVHVGEGARVGALSLVTKDVGKGGTAVGNPQREHKEHFRVHALLSKLLAERRSK